MPPPFQQLEESRLRCGLFVGGGFWVCPSSASKGPQRRLMTTAETSERATALAKTFRPKLPSLFFVQPFIHFNGKLCFTAAPTTTSFSKAPALPSIQSSHTCFSVLLPHLPSFPVYCSSSCHSRRRT